jgi:hypothetical protein
MKNKTSNNSSLSLYRLAEVFGLKHKKSKQTLTKKKKGKNKDKKHKKVSRTKDKKHKKVSRTKDKKHKKVSRTKDKKYKKVSRTKDKKYKKISRTLKDKKYKKVSRTLKDKKHKKISRTLKDNKHKKVSGTKDKKKNKYLSNPLCDTCIKVIKDIKNPGSIISINKEDWKEFPYHIPLLGNSNNIKKQEVNINLGKQYSNRLIYYFGSKLNCKSNKYPLIYKNSTNNGLVYLDNNGCGIAYVDCPSSYLDLPPKLMKNKSKLRGYINHIHMLISDKSKSKWEDKMITQNVLCKINKSEYLNYVNSNNRIIINALEEKYNIQGTNLILNYKKAKKYSADKIRTTIKNTAINNNKLKKILNNNDITDVGLIVYCHNPSCTAAKQLAIELYNAGFYNILYYSEGFLGFHGRKY